MVKRYKSVSLIGKVFLISKPWKKQKSVSSAGTVGAVTRPAPVFN